MHQQAATTASVSMATTKILQLEHYRVTTQSALYVIIVVRPVLVVPPPAPFVTQLPIDTSLLLGVCAIQGISSC